MLIAMAGLPGSGKSTLAEALAAELAVPVISVDPIEMAILRAGIDDDQPTGLAAYLVAETLAESVLASGRGIIVDAVNPVDPAREQWVGVAQRQDVPVRFVEVICSDAVVHGARLSEHARTRDVRARESVAVEQSTAEYAQWSGASGAVPRLVVDSVDPVELLVPRVLAFLAD